MWLIGQLDARRGTDREGPDPAAQLSRGDHRQQPRRLVGRSDRGDRGVRVMRAYEHRVGHARTLDVIDVARLSAHHGQVLTPRQRLADHAPTLNPSRARIQSATSGRYLNGMLLQTWVPSS